VASHEHTFGRAEDEMQTDTDLEKSTIGGGKPLPPSLLDPEAYIVDFEGPSDGAQPGNWSSGRKLAISCIVCFGTLQASLSSALFAPATIAASSHFGVSYEVGTLGTALFVLGFASGPIVWAPASELIGRRWPIFLGLFMDSIFVVASGAANDIQTLIICRFFSGFCGASQLSIVPAVLSDMYSNAARGQAITVYALTVFVGPLAAPFIGAFITESYLGWRWTLFLPAILGFADSLLMLVFVPETYAPVILAGKAAQLRHISKNYAIHAVHEEKRLDLGEIFHKNVLRPLEMLISEPVLLLVTLYMSFIYGLVYALVAAYPYIFATTYGMRPGPAALPCISLILGVCTACVCILLQQPVYVKKLKANQNVPVPEWRLNPPLVGAPVFTAAIFW
jgi:MFS transporter, DHA1 family, multidrug resistance protein